MKRDAWYAAIAAFGLCAAAAGYALISAAKLADPDVTLDRPKLTASLPSPPQHFDDSSILETAQLILREHDPFTERSSDETAGSRGLSLPKLGAPVRFSVPDESGTVTAAAPAPAPPRTLQPQSAIPQAPVPPAPRTPTQPPQPARGSLTLRGVFPTPSGGRALVALPNGQVVSVGIGGTVGGWRVLQIQQGAIRLGRGQRAILLAMPR